MNPIQHYETNAKKIWASTIDPEVKAKRLYELSDAVHRYVRRLEHNQAETLVGDAWTRSAMNRGRSYLIALAEDVRHLAVKCQQEAAGHGQKAS